MNWIDVKEKLPEYGVTVLVFGNIRGMNPQMGGYAIHMANRVDTRNTAIHKNRDKYVDENDFAMMDLVTHWMPLPEKPTGKK